MDPKQAASIDVTGLTEAERRLVEKHVEACRSRHVRTNGAKPAVELGSYPGRGLVENYRRGELYEGDE